MTYPCVSIISNKDNNVLQAIQDYWREFSVPPAIRDVQKRTGIGSTSVVRYHYMRLEKCGAIKRIKGKPVPVEISQLIKEIYQS